MESSSPNRVRGDSRSRPNIHACVDSGQSSHALSIHEQGQAIGRVVNILQKIDQPLQRAAQPVQVIPQRVIINIMAKYRPIKFLGKKDDEPSTAENWLGITERMVRQMNYRPKKNLECATSLLQDDAYQ